MKKLVWLVLLVACGPKGSGPPAAARAGSPPGAWTRLRCNTLDTCQQSCDKAEPGGCERLGMWTVFTPEAPPRAQAALAKACDAGLRVCIYVALRSCSAKDAEDPAAPCLARTAALLKQGCAAGDPDACQYLSRGYDQGSGGLTRDPARARQLLNEALDGFRRACDAGDPNGCAQAAEILTGGEGVTRDDVAARKLAVQAVQGYDKLCGVGDAMACYLQALAYKNGRGVPPDLEHAKKLLAQACLLGLPMKELCQEVNPPPPG